jgi:aryl-alcohol dehydrogenase-like predicted oxidoreductase
VLATKVFMPGPGGVLDRGTSRRHVFLQVEESLRRLRTDWIDLAQPTVSSVIAGATSPEQVAANVKAGQWIPTTDDLAEIDRITQLHREG